MSRWTVTVASLLCTLSLAGCGGDSGGSSGAEEWADEVCTSLSTWRRSMQAAGDSLRSGNLSKENVQGVADEIGSATEQLVGELKGLDEPDTKSGAEAKKALDDLGDDLQKGIGEIQRASEETDTPQESRKALSTIVATLGQMANEFASTFQTLEQLDPAGELEQAFEDSDACTELTS
jgi:hypothetical protein